MHKVKINTLPIQLAITFTIYKVVASWTNVWVHAIRQAVKARLEREERMLIVI